MNLGEPMGLEEDAPHGRGVGRGVLWFGLLGGGVAWTGHLLSAYLIAEFGCVSGLGERSVRGVTVVAWLVIAASIAALLLAVAAAGVAYRTRARLTRGAHPDGKEAVEESDPELDLARTGLITSAMFVLIIAVETIPIFYYLRHC